MAIGSDIVARAMKTEGVTDFFYIMGGPRPTPRWASLTRQSPRSRKDSHDGTTHRDDHDGEMIF